MSIKMERDPVFVFGALLKKILGNFPLWQRKIMNKLIAARSGTEKVLFALSINYGKGEGAQIHSS